MKRAVFTFKKNTAPCLLMVLITLSMLFAACQNNSSSKAHAKNDTIPKPGKVQVTAIAGNFNQKSGIAFDSAAVQKFLAARPLFKPFEKDFATFYSANHYNYVWYGKTGLIETSNALISAIDNENISGVSNKIPYYEEFKQLLQNDTGKANLTSPDITTELMLTAQYFNYAKNIWAGSVNEKAESIDWFLPRKKLSYVALLQDNLSNGNLQATEEANVTPQYEGLKKELARYRDIDKAGNEVMIPTSKKRNLKANDSSDLIPLLQQRLKQLGVIKEDVTGNTYNVAMMNAINDLKQRYGLKPDSVITTALINEMNVPAKKRIEQILVNMERFRWIPVTRDAKEFILINIPEFALHYYEDNKHVWECNVVVGKPMTKTVIFSGMMKYVIFSPYWNVPPSIINKEVKPGMKRNSNYLAKHNMEWNGGQVRQKPGLSNSLGLVKFIFPNSNNIYLHDTPSKSLFGEDQRAFSHGCVRVGKPRDLAIRILKQAPEWTPEKIDSAMHAGKEKTVTLKQQIPVYIGYFTAFMKDGQLNFRPDIYQNDAKLLAMLVQN